MGDRGLWTKAPILYYSSCRESLRSVFKRCFPRENEEEVRNVRIRGVDDVTSIVRNYTGKLDKSVMHGGPTYREILNINIEKKC